MMEYYYPANRDILNNSWPHTTTEVSGTTTTPTTGSHSPPTPTPSHSPAPCSSPTISMMMRTPLACRRDTTTTTTHYYLLLRLTTTYMVWPGVTLVRCWPGAILSLAELGSY